MKTIIKVIDEQNIDFQIIRQAGDIIKSGGLVAFPTETVYGLGADALNKNAAKKIYRAKGRPSDNPLIVHIADLKALNKIIRNAPKELQELAKHFWPGPLTIVLHKSGNVPHETTGGLETVAVRMPENKVARELILAGGGYISAPSANISGRPSPTSGKHVEADMKGRIEMILDGGSVKIGVESTILDMTVIPPRILRPGAVTKEMLEEVLPHIETDMAMLNAEKLLVAKAPGMKYKHYAPKAPMMVVEGTTQEMELAIRQFAARKEKEGLVVGIICTEESVKQYPSKAVKNIGARLDEKSIAQNLYAILREFDQEKVDYILSEAFPEEGIGAAVMNRLYKAAGYQRIKAAEIIEQSKSQEGKQGK